MKKVSLLTQIYKNNERKSDLKKMDKDKVIFCIAWKEAFVMVP